MLRQFPDKLRSHVATPSGPLRSLPGLTGIRGIAALWVVFFHIWILDGAVAPQHVPAAVPVICVGWVGVDLFFILSGFILMHTHERDFSSSPLRAAPAFYKARFLRVYPLNAVVLLLIAVLMASDHMFAAAYAARGPGNLSAIAFVKTLTLSTRWLPGSGEWNEPVWSLSAEIVGYAGFPLLAYLVGRFRSTPTAAAAVMGCIVVPLIYLYHRQQFGRNAIDPHAALVRMGAEFAAGIALYRLRQLLPPLTTRTVNALGAGAALAVIVLALLPAGTAWMPVAFAAIILALSFQTGGVVERLMGHRVTLSLGRISFPLYLVHITPLLWLNAH